MATMKTLNGYGFNATEFDGKTSDSYLQKTGIAADSAKLGGKAPEYYLQPRNLLDNSYWKRISEIVNQRGQTSYSGQVYGIDRWYGRSYDQKTEVRGNDITVTATNVAYAGIKQKVCNIAELAGEAVTLAVYVYSTLPVAVGFVDADDNAVYETVDNGSGTRIILCTCTVPSDATTDTFIPRILLRTNAKNDYMRCYWAALYEGSYTAETLPPYVPKGYTVELAECQRYYLSGVGSFTTGLMVSSTTARFIIPTPVTMRFFPQVQVVTLDNAITYTDSIAAHVINPVTAISVTALELNSVTITVTLADVATLRSPVTLYGTKFNLIADL